MIATITGSAIAPALALLPAKLTSPQAFVMLIAIGLQESGLTDRVQKNGGPARGLWQFEQGGGIRGVLRHDATGGLAAQVCEARDVPAVAAHVWAQLPHDDILAAAFARLLLYSDPQPLPKLGDEVGAWALYLRTWRPGRPHPERWPGNYAQALLAVA